jgi:hypothetical protein
VIGIFGPYVADIVDIAIGKVSTAKGVPQ